MWRRGRKVDTISQDIGSWPPLSAEGFSILYRADWVNTFASRELIFRAGRMANDVVKLINWDGHTSCDGNGGILDRISGRWRENTTYLLSAPGENHDWSARVVSVQAHNITGGVGTGPAACRYEETCSSPGRPS